MNVDYLSPAMSRMRTQLDRSPTENGPHPALPQGRRKDRRYGRLQIPTGQAALPPLPLRLTLLEESLHPFLRIFGLHELLEVEALRLCQTAVELV